jgi:predicted DCC family thiol-disulfide oxidoreductase YuxK
MTARTRPALVYDGDCAFCSTCVRLLERIGSDAEMVAWQLMDLAEMGLTQEQAAAAVQWIEIDGTVRSGHEAIAAALSTAGGIWAFVGRALLSSGISSIAAATYRLIADNRHRLPGGTPACAVDPQEIRRSTSRSIFARRLTLSLLLALAVGRICSPSRKRRRHGRAAANSRTVWNLRSAWRCCQREW